MSMRSGENQQEKGRNVPLKSPSGHTGKRPQLSAALLRMLSQEEPPAVPGPMDPTPGCESKSQTELKKAHGISKAS